MRVLSWNCQGLGADLTKRNLSDLWNKWKPNVLFLSETKQSYCFLDSFKLSFGYNKLFTVDPVGSSGGLAIFYNDDLNLDIISSNNRFIDTMANFKGDKFFMTFVYGDPVVGNRQRVWDQLYDISSNRFGPWLMVGDFNEIIGSNEKRGGKLRSPNSFLPFRNMINHCGMLEFPCEGNNLSWRGVRFQKHNGTRIRHVVRCRLDRALGNGHWLHLFSQSKVRYLPMIGSDHRPIVGIFNKISVQRSRNFKFDKRWLGREGLKEAVSMGWNRTRNFRTTSFSEKIENCRNSISWWRKNNVLPGHLAISNLKDALEEAKADDSMTDEEIDAISRKLQDAYRDNEIFWQQKSRTTWLQEGDQNTNFFHTATKIRRARNVISSLLDDNGAKVETDTGIEEIATDYFHGLFKAIPTSNSTEFVSAIPRKVTDEMNQRLLREVTEDEVKNALFNMHPEKAPGPDGMTALFYQRFWGEVKTEVVSLVQNFLRTRTFDPGLNLTNICLIPKVDTPSVMGEFRPISLCNISYKIISKVLCIRLKEIMPSLISETQSAFVSGRLISDNILIAQEMFHALKTKEKVRKECLAIKTDMSKAYDRLEWSFLENILTQLGFHPHWVSCIMWCVTTVSFQVLLNGCPKGYIIPQKGIRQGDPLSPYLFILCTEALTANIRQKEIDKTMTGIKIASGSPAISHLLFADDSLFFCKATKSECEVILKLLADYEAVSGQMINYDKSSVVFGNKVPTQTQHELKSLLGIQKEGGMGNYLGIPENLSGSKTKVFGYVKEALNGRVNGWSSKLLSKGGKEVLLKSVAFALPTHVMSCFRLPQTVITSLHSEVSNFWWGSTGTSKGIHWKSWDYLCTKKQDGGLGFRSLYDFNTAMLAKQLWRLEKYPESLVARVLRGRYYRNSHPFYAAKGYSPSYGWSSLVSAQKLILDGTRWQVGDGVDILVWEDSWIPDIQPRPARGMGMEFYPNLYVKDLFLTNGDGWNIPLLNQLLEPEDVLMVRGLTLRPTVLKDRAVWHFSKTGEYTVKSGYEFIQTQNHVNAHREVLEPSFKPIMAHVWIIDCPPKIRHFLWQVLNNALAVLTGLKQRGVNTDGVCKVCGIEAETINHVLFECAEAKETWRLLHFTQTELSFPSTSIYINMDLLFSRAYSWKTLSGVTMNSRDIFPWILWYLWKSRNKKTFQGIGWSSLEIIQLAEKELDTWKAAKAQPRQTENQPVNLEAQTRLPSNRCLVDGSWLREANTSGLGWICYSQDIPILMGNCGTRRSLSPLHTEFEALLWAMQEILARDLPCSTFVTDCTDLQKIIGDPKAWPAFDVYCDIFAELRRRFSTFSLVHIKRESNRQADALARHARDRSVEFSVVDMYPPGGLNSFFSM